MGKICPACASGLPASKTKVGEARLLCVKHEAELNDMLRGVIAAHPDVDDTATDLQPSVPKAKLRPSKAQSGGHLEDQIDAILETLVYGFLPNSERIYLEKVPSKQYSDIKKAKTALLHLIEQAVTEARLSELKLACEDWEKNPTLPATYLIDRTATLQSQAGKE